MNNYALKTMLAIVLCVLGIAQSHGQKLTVGAKVGVNINTFTGPLPSLGYSAGGYASYELLPFLNVKVEPQLSTVGGGRPEYYFYNYANSPDQYETQYLNRVVRLSTFEVPLLAELTLPEFANEKIVPKLIIGGSYALMIKGVETHTQKFEFNNTVSGDIDVGYLTQTVTDQYARNQFSAIAGLGLLFKTEKRNFQLDVRYRQGLTQVNRLQQPSALQGFQYDIYDGAGGRLYTSSLSLNFSIQLFKF